MDVLLIIASIIISIFLLLVNFYILVIYSHPDDRGWGVSIWCRILVIFGLTLSWAQVLMLPLDVSNSVGSGGGLDMDNFWIAIYMMLAIMVIFLMPTSIYVYESDEEKSMCSRLCYATFLEICTLIVVSLILFISWAFLKYADIPFTLAAKSVSYMENSSTDLTSTSLLGQINSEQILEVVCSFPIYVISITSFVGWWFFVLFGGVGLSALPMDLINEFLGRPVWRSSREQAENKILLKKKTEELISWGLRLNEEKKELTVAEGFWEKRKKKGSYKSDANKFKTAVFSLEKMHEIFKLELQLQTVNPLVYWAKLFLGIFFVVVSIIWWIHILVFIIIRPNGIPLHLFLNNFLIALEQANAGFLATLLFAFLSLYLLWATTKGNFKFGVRVPFLFTIHPMKKNETWMNSFLFNILLILICSVSVTQFCTNAFSQYARLTSIDPFIMIFGAQVRYMKFFTYFFANNVFEYILLIWSALCALYLILKPSDKPEIIKQIERIKKQKKYDPNN